MSRTTAWVVGYWRHCTIATAAVAVVALSPSIAAGEDPPAAASAATVIDDGGAQVHGDAAERAEAPGKARRRAKREIRQAFRAARKRGDVAPPSHELGAIATRARGGPSTSVRIIVRDGEARVIVIDGEGVSHVVHGRDRAEAERVRAGAFAEAGRARDHARRHAARAEQLRRRAGEEAAAAREEVLRHHAADLERMLRGAEESGRITSDQADAIRERMLRRPTPPPRPEPRRLETI